MKMYNFLMMSADESLVIFSDWLIFSIHDVICCQIKSKLKINQSNTAKLPKSPFGFNVLLKDICEADICWLSKHSPSLMLSSLFWQQELAENPSASDLF